MLKNDLRKMKRNPLCHSGVGVVEIKVGIATLECPRSLGILPLSFTVILIIFP